MTGEAYAREVAAAMPEAALLNHVIGIARLYGWRSAHFRPAQTARGRHITAVAGDGKGYPDLTLVHGPAGRLVFAELKSQRGTYGPGQAEWLTALDDVAIRVDGIVAVHTWRPADLLDGTIEGILRVSPRDRAAAHR